MARVRSPKRISSGGSGGGKRRGKKKLPKGDGGYTASEERYTVREVVDWRLNTAADMLEWKVVWDVDSSTTWEPNFLASGYSLAIFNFVSNATDLPHVVSGP